MMKGMFVAAFAVISAAQLTAVGSSLHAQAADRPALNACTLLSAQEIKRITGRDDLATAAPHIEQLPGRSNCIYPGSQNLGITVLETPRKMFDRARDMYRNAPPTYKLITFEPATGVGEEAYLLTHNDTQNVVKLVAWVGSRELTIALERGRTQKQQVTALAKAAAAKLR
jgi:hypothetical protein